MSASNITPLPLVPALPRGGGLTYKNCLYRLNFPSGGIRAGEQFLMLEKIYSLCPGSGFGTFAYRRLMYEAIVQGYPSTHIVTNACRTSHLFHLYMGMKPVNIADFGILISKLLGYYRFNSQKIPDAKVVDFGSFYMEMSPEGLARWSDDIHQVAPFTLFKDLSHLKTMLKTYCVWQKESSHHCMPPILNDDAIDELVGRLHGKIPIQLPCKNSV